MFCNVALSLIFLLVEQVIFEAEVGSEQRKDIAIDDLTILNDPCPPPG